MNNGLRVRDYSGLFDDLISVTTDVFEAAGETALQSLETSITETITSLIPKDETITNVTTETVTPMTTEREIIPDAIMAAAPPTAAPPPPPPVEGIGGISPLLILVGALFFM